MQFNLGATSIPNSMQPILKSNIPAHANPVFPLTQEMCTSNVHKHISSYTHILH